MTLIANQEMFKGGKYSEVRFDEFLGRTKYGPRTELEDQNFFTQLNTLAEIVEQDVRSLNSGYSKSVFVGGDYQVLVTYIENNTESQTYLFGAQRASNPKITVYATGELAKVDKLHKDLSARLNS